LNKNFFRRSDKTWATIVKQHAVVTY